MDEQSAQWLNHLNQVFYATVHEAFDTTRGQPWPGWTRLLPHAKAARTVLDVGCGNGRFGAFLAEQGGLEQYHGLDNNPELLAKAATKMSAYSQVETRLDPYDLMTDSPPNAHYDAVVLFGVLHHVPGVARRQALLAQLARRVAPGGILAFACWRFLEYERFRARLVPMPPHIQAETGDYLLDWRRDANALRYCHYVDDDELETLISATGLMEVERFRADGAVGNMNFYVVLRAESSSAAEGA